MTVTTPPRRSIRRRQRQERRAVRWRGRVVDGALGIAAVFGVLCIGLVVAAQIFNISIIMFRTGSMEPTIPAGAASLVQRVDARELEVGDVVTVDRDQMLPVTHRVTSVSSPDAAGVVTITMRGDANPVDDPEPYRITDARRVLASVPGGAAVISTLGHPLWLGGITVGAAALVGFAFWPRGDEARKRGDS